MKKSFYFDESKYNYKKFSDLKVGETIYKLTLNNQIEYDGEFKSLVKPILEKSINKYKIKDLLYPGIVQGPSYHYMDIKNHGIGTTHSLKYDDNYVTIILDNDEEHSLRNNCYSSSYNNFISFGGDNIYFSQEEALKSYLKDYCEFYILNYAKEIENLQNKINLYTKFKNAC